MTALDEETVRRIVREEMQAALDGWAGPTPQQPVPASPWELIPEVRVSGTGSRSYMLTVGNPCRVKGEGRGGGVGSGYTVIGLMRHRQTQAVNVEVRRYRNGHSRVFRLDRIVYVRPKNVTPKG